MEKSTGEHFNLCDLVVLRIRGISDQRNVFQIHRIEILQYGVHHLLVLEDGVQEGIGCTAHFKDGIEDGLLDIVVLQPIVDF